MKRFVEGDNRGQSTLLPECLDDWIVEKDPVRAIDAFVDAPYFGRLIAMNVPELFSCARPWSVALRGLAGGMANWGSQASRCSEP